MNEQYRNEQIKKFLADAGMASAVRQCILDSFMKKREHKDVYMTAAERIAIDLLSDAFKDMEVLKNTQTTERVKNLSHV